MNDFWQSYGSILWFFVFFSNLWPLRFLEPFSVAWIKEMHFMHFAFAFCLHSSVSGLDVQRTESSSSSPALLSETWVKAHLYTVPPKCSCSLSPLPLCRWRLEKKPSLPFRSKTSWQTRKIFKANDGIILSTHTFQPVTTHVCHFSHGMIMLTLFYSAWNTICACRWGWDILYLHSRNPSAPATNKSRRTRHAMAAVVPLSSVSHGAAIQKIKGEKKSS